MWALSHSDVAWRFLQNWATECWIRMTATLRLSSLMPDQSYNQAINSWKIPYLLIFHSLKMWQRMRRAITWNINRVHLSIRASSWVASISGAPWLRYRLRRPFFISYSRVRTSTARKIMGYRVQRRRAWLTIQLFIILKKASQSLEELVQKYDHAN